MTRVCSIEGCTNPVYKRGWCGVHVGRWERHGDPHRHALRGRERVLAKIDVRGGDDCWPIQSQAINRSGHRQVWWQGRMVLAHRLVYELEVGPIPDGMVVMHRCDNPPCVNWNRHLHLGTVADNNRDRDIKGRHARLRGSKVGTSKLSEWQVREIRRRGDAGESHYAIADDYGVTQGCIWRIVRRLSWAHVTDEPLTAPTPQEQ